MEPDHSGREEGRAEVGCQAAHASCGRLVLRRVSAVCSPRHYHTPSLVNYGAFPQTWEDPTENTGDGQGACRPLPEGCCLRPCCLRRSCQCGPCVCAVDWPGDNDPLDVLEIGKKVATVGEIYNVKVLGALGMVDDGEVDWKIIAVRDTDPLATDPSGAPVSVFNYVGVASHSSLHTQP